ncbi:MAG TPA: ABC transporter substrate binding protein [Stellaceae bacterium]|nr:ABC transporter substrate binding protein [Stellaceae bacterium]
MVMLDAFNVANRELIITLVARYGVPALYGNNFAESGGLIFYGTDTVETFRLGAGYIDRILKGEKPGELPIQLPTKFELAINLKTAKALGLTVPPTLLARQRGDRVASRCRLLAVRPEGANHQWRRNPSRELSLDLVADERLVRVTGRAGAS